MPIEVWLAIVAVIIGIAWHMLAERTRRQKYLTLQRRANRSQGLYQDFRGQFPEIGDDILRPLYHGVQEFIQLPDFPLHAEIRLNEDLQLERLDVEDISFGVLKTANKVLPKPDESPIRQILTIRDWVIFLSSCPSRESHQLPNETIG